MMPQPLNSKNYSDEIYQSEIPVFVDFWANWCPPCRMMDSVMQELADEFENRIKFCQLNTDLFKGVAKRYSVVGIPTYILFYRGEEIWRNTGAMSKDAIVKVLETHLK